MHPRSGLFLIIFWRVGVNFGEMIFHALRWISKPCI